MKNLLLLLFLLSIFNFVNAQDLIVTVGQDSIKCKINEIQNNHIYFEITHKGTIKSSFLPQNRIANYEYGFYNKTKTINSFETLNTPNINKFRVSLNGGMSYRLSSIHSGIPDFLYSHFEKLRKGYTFGAQGSYFFKDQLGIGLKYSHFNSSNEEDIDNIGFIRDQISINYIGPSFLYSFKKMKKTEDKISVGGSIGYMNYINHSTAILYQGVQVQEDATISGNTIGLNFFACYDLYLSDVFSLGLQFDLLIGSITTIEVDQNGQVQNITLPNGSAEGLSRIDLTLALVINQ